jgi:hypothetical protein
MVHGGGRGSGSDSVVTCAVNVRVGVCVYYEMDCKGRVGVANVSLQSQCV